MIKLSRRNFLMITFLNATVLFSKLRGRKKIYPRGPQKSSPTSGYDPWIELDLENMKWNLNKIRKLVKVPVMAVIKANAYGHGLVEVGRYLEKKAIDYLMVGKLQEALLLRKAGVTSPLLNFGFFCPEEAEKIIQNDISQSVFTEEVTFLNKTSLHLGKKAKIQSLQTC